MRRTTLIICLSVLFLCCAESYAEEMLLDFNAGSGTNWEGWTWSDDVAYNHPGWTLDSDGPLGGGETFRWGYGPRCFEGGRTYTSVTAVIDQTDRAPSTDSGGCFKAFEEAISETTYSVNWWLWYDGKPLAERGVTDENTDRWSFYLKTDTVEKINDDGGSGSVGNNFHVGTYICWNDGRPVYGQGDGCPYEGPGNQHYYHYLAINPGAWLHVELDNHPTHRRNSRVIGNDPTFIESGVHYLEHLHQMYLQITEFQSELATMKVDEMKFYSTQDTVEPNQNESSITSPWVGYWSDNDYWEMGWQDMSWEDEGGDRNDNTHSTFEIRWSIAPITNDNYDQATVVTPLFYGGVEHTGEANLLRRQSSWNAITWTRFTLPDGIEQYNDRIYFAIKDVSVAGGHVGTRYPWNRGDGHDAPTSNIRTIDYYLRPEGTSPPCIPEPEICNDGIDNDCDGQIDCDDADSCSTDPVCIQPLGITTTSLPNATQGIAYYKELSAAGGVAPYSWSGVGTLPGWLDPEDLEDGVLSGTPTAIGTENFTLQVTDSINSDTVNQDYSITVSEPGATYQWGITDPPQGPGGTYVAHSRAMGGTSPPDDNMIIREVSMYSANRTETVGNIRLAVYSGGVIVGGTAFPDNNPLGATLLCQTPVIHVNQGAKWYSEICNLDENGNTISGDVILPANTPTWVAWKNDANAAYRYSTSAAESGDFETGRYDNNNFGNGGNIIPSDKFPDPYTGNGGFDASYYLVNLTYEILSQTVESGDINGDGVVDLTDVILSLQVVSGLEPNGITLEGEANSDSHIGIAEAITALRKTGD